MRYLKRRFRLVFCSWLIFLIVGFTARYVLLYQFESNIIISFPKMCAWSAIDKFFFFFFWFSVFDYLWTLTSSLHILAGFGLSFKILPVLLAIWSFKDTLVGLFNIKLFSLYTNHFSHQTTNDSLILFHYVYHSFRCYYRTFGLDGQIL